MYKFLLFSSSLLLITFYSYSETYYRPMKRINATIWKADSFYVGAGIKSSGKGNIIVKKVYSKTDQIGSLYYVNHANDSLTFLFGNKDTIKEVDIGNQSIELPITFVYVVNNNEQKIKNIVGKKLYSGQNRVNVDKYISEISNGIFGKIWAIAGQVDSTTVQVGFEANGSFMFQDIVFFVSNSMIQK